MIAYVHLENGKTVTSRRNHKPRGLICECPKDAQGEWITDINILDVDPVAKTAVFNQTKFDLVEESRATKSADDQATRDLDISQRNDVMAIDVDKMVNDLDKTKLKKVLRWLIKRTR